MSSPLVQARVLGALDLAVLFFGSFPMFVQSRTLVPGNPVATADAILASESLFLLGITSSVVMSTLFVFIGLLWYRLLSPVGRGTVRAMAALILVGLPIALGNELNPVAALRLAQEQEHSLVSRVLGLLLMIGSPGWVIRCVQGLLFPGSEATLWSNPPLVLTDVAELSMMAWLLIKGVDVERWRERAAAEATR